MAEVIWIIKAVTQVEQIGSYIEKDSPFQARRVVQLILKGDAQAQRCTQDWQDDTRGGGRPVSRTQSLQLSNSV